MGPAVSVPVSKEPSKELAITYLHRCAAEPFSEQPIGLQSGQYQMFEIKGAHFPCESIRVENCPCDFSLLPDTNWEIKSKGDTVTFEGENLNDLREITGSRMTESLSRMGVNLSCTLNLSRLDRVKFKTDRPLNRDEISSISAILRLHNILFVYPDGFRAVFVYSC